MVRAKIADASSQTSIQPQMMKIRKVILIAPLMLATSFLPVTASAQYRNQNPNFYNGVRNGGRGGDYYDNSGRYDNNNGYYNNNGYNNNGYNNNGYNNDRHDRDRHQGGIGPGKGALIGAGGGAILGAIFGRGLKGTLIGGAAGAGIGAVVGEVHQNSRDQNNRDNRYDNRDNRHDRDDQDRR